jgi:hypothetical protein
VDDVMDQSSADQTGAHQGGTLQAGTFQTGTFQTWRISTFTGALIACYFIPTWTIFAFRIMVSPIQGFYERPNISLALFLSDYMQFSSMGTVRYAWLLAIGKLTVVAFFTVFLVFITRPKIRKTGGCDEALMMALGIGGVISFASMMMASKVGEIAAMRLHITELLLLLGTAVLMAIEPPLRRAAAQELDPGQPGKAANDAELLQKVA